MTTLYIILTIICVIAIVLFIMVLLSNETDKNVEDAFVPVWMSLIFLTIPWWGLCLLFRKLNFADIPLWTTLPVCIFGLIAGFVSGYKALKNFLITKNEYLISERLKIDSEYKKRFELIPNLVKVIKSYTENENQNIERVLRTREQVMKSYSENNRKQLDQSVNVLLHSAYDYPALQSMPLYRSLNAQLINTQENITYYTSVYNEKVSDFNKDLKQFPANLFWKNMNLEPVQYLDTNVTNEQKDATTLLNHL